MGDDGVVPSFVLLCSERELLWRDRGASLRNDASRKNLAAENGRPLRRTKLSHCAQTAPGCAPTSPRYRAPSSESLYQRSKGERMANNHRTAALTGVFSSVNNPETNLTVHELIAKYGVASESCARSR